MCNEKEAGPRHPFEVGMSFSTGVVDEVGWEEYSRQRERHRLMREQGVLAEHKPRAEWYEEKEERRLNCRGGNLSIHTTAQPALES